MAASKQNPAFRPVRPTSSGRATPEDLFYKLSGRVASHGYLRGPQQDVLREYGERYADTRDLAFELPTGTGKTVVGLLIGEWKRTSGNKVAYVSLTNQLAGQVLSEANKVGIPCADLRGTKETRSALEEGRYRTGAAMAVSTYSNLFNINPVLQNCDVVIFDDAHGAERYVSDMWTVSASAFHDPALYNSLVSALRPSLSSQQIRSILDKSSNTVELIDISAHPESIDNVTAVLDPVTKDTVRFAWKLIRNHLQTCLFLASSYEITVRPLVSPTHTHEPFASLRQRIYMSATLGGDSDLQRAYGIEKLDMVRAKSTQWGRRYVFIPGMYVEKSEAERLAARVWDDMKTRRAVLLTPSDRVMSRTLDALELQMRKKPARLGASDIANTLDGFVTSSNALLALAGRYDGLDLPDEQCRLLILSESPAAINPLERYLSERWKMGPIFRKRERTRLIQGMGRCTRNATDFAVIIWLGQSLVNAATAPTLMRGFPPALGAEIKWGGEQSAVAAGGSDDFVAMISGLINDPKYRREADAAIDSIQATQQESQPSDYEEAGKDEVRYSKSMWDENFEVAYQTARGIADQLTSAEVAGYRAWWWYLASSAASLFGDTEGVRDCLTRAARCGVNPGWINGVLRTRQGRSNQRETQPPAGPEPNGDGLWELLVNWGWAGPSFEKTLATMQNELADPYHVRYHEGLETLGKAFGAATTRTTDQGAPDVVWSFASDFHIAFEAKTEKKPMNPLSKRDVQEAKGHADWARTHLCGDSADAEIATVVVAPSAALHQIALPFAGGLYYISPDRVVEIAGEVVEGLRELRIRFSGREFADSVAEFSAAIRRLNLSIERVRNIFLAKPLKE